MIQFVDYKINIYTEKKLVKDLISVSDKQYLSRSLFQTQILLPGSYFKLTGSVNSTTIKNSMCYPVCINFSKGTSELPNQICVHVSIKELSKVIK